MHRLTRRVVSEAATPDVLSSTLAAAVRRIAELLDEIGDRRFSTGRSEALECLVQAWFLLTAAAERRVETVEELEETDDDALSLVFQATWHEISMTLAEVLQTSVAR